MSMEHFYNVSEAVADASEVFDFRNFTEGLVESTTDFLAMVRAPVENAKHQATLNLYAILIPSIGAFSILLNFAVVISSGLILKKGQQPRATYLFLGNVAMTDLITSLSVVFGQVYPNEYREHYICSLQIGMIVSSTLASVFSVGLIAIDRYLYIIHGLQYQKWVYATRARICIGITWIIGCIVGFLPLMGWYGDTKNGKQCWFILLAPKELIVLTIALGGIPLITVVILYSVILYHAIKNIYRLQKARQSEAANNPGAAENGLRIFRGKTTEPDPEPEQPQGKPKNLFKRVFMSNPTNKVKGPNKWKAIKVVFFTSGSFVMTWGPYFVCSLIYVYSKDPERIKSLSILIASPLAILGFFNTLINPVIYAWWHKGFRSFVKRWFSMMRRKKQADSITTSKNTSSTSPRKSSTSSNNVSGEETVKIGPLPTTTKNAVMANPTSNKSNGQEIGSVQDEQPKASLASLTDSKKSLISSNESNGEGTAKIDAKTENEMKD